MHSTKIIKTRPQRRIGRIFSLIGDIKGEIEEEKINEEIEEKEVK